MTELHRVLDTAYTPERLEEILAGGADPNERVGPIGETALHVAVRRRRAEAVPGLVRHGASVDLETSGGMTAIRHAARRGFSEVVDALREHGASDAWTPSDRFAIAINANDLDAARAMLAEDPDLVRRATAPEETRLLADIAGREQSLAAVELLIDTGAPLDGRGLDGGTALHQAAWFGQPKTLAYLLERGADRTLLCTDHRLTPLGWVAHGSRYSGGADHPERGRRYVRMAEILLDAGATLDEVRDVARSDAVGSFFRSRSAGG